MKTDFNKSLTEFLAKAEGMPEPIYDDKMNTTNWPKDFRKSFEEIVGQIGYCWNDEEFLEFAVWLELYENKKVPRTIILSFVKCFYDNPNVPSQGTIIEAAEKKRRGLDWRSTTEPMRLADAKGIIASHNIPWTATVEAAGIIANSPEATFEDLLGLLKISGLPQEWAAIALYKRTKRQSENRLNLPSTDYNDWFAYLKNENLI